MDITNGIEQLITIIINILAYAWNMLESIEIWNINLLEYTITIFIISIIIPIIFTIVQSGTALGSQAIRSEINHKRNVERRKTK